MNNSTVRIGTKRSECPKIRHFGRFDHDNELAVCFMLRSCAVPPADIVTMYLGATGVSSRANVIGGVLGSLPAMVLNIAWNVLSALGFLRLI